MKQKPKTNDKKVDDKSYPFSISKKFVKEGKDLNLF